MVNEEEGNGYCGQLAPCFLYKTVSERNKIPFLTNSKLDR